MKVLHVVNDADVGGAQTLIEALMRESSPEVQSHVLVLLGRGDLSSRLEEAASSVTHLGMHRRDVFPVSAMRALLRLVREHEIDIVHSHLQQSDVVNVLTPHGRPRISTLHSSMDLSSNIIARVVWRITALLSGRFNAVVACSPSALDYAREAKYRFDPADMRIIFNGSQVSPSTPAHTDSRTLLHLARFTPSKDHTTLLHALAIVARRLPEVRLRCAGNGVDLDNEFLTNMLDDLDIRRNVELLGPISGVRTEIRHATAVVLSSCNEALPMAGIESLTEGTPVVTTDVGDARELVVDQRTLVPARDPRALAEAMEWVLTCSPEEKATLRDGCRQLALAKFDVRKCSKQYTRLYQELA